jgi:GT2 family glycosyltransferase
LRGRSVSVIIPAYNEEKKIAGCIESIMSTKYPQLEILVVDDKSTDKTVEVASGYPIRLIKRAMRGERCVARNDGLREAKGEIVVFVDADCTVEEHALEILVSDFSDTKIAGVGGVVLTKETGLVAKYRSYASREDWLDSKEVVETSYLPGGICAYLADALRSVGGFNPSVGRHETFELGLRLREKEYRLLGEPKAIVWHGHEGNLARWLGAAYGTGHDALSLLSLGEHRTSAVLVAQMRQIAFLCYLILLAATVIKAVPLYIALWITASVVVLETARAFHNAWEVAVHYENMKYLAMFPLELLLRVFVYAGYLAALLTTFRMTSTRFLKRSYMEK